MKNYKTMFKQTSFMLLQKLISLLKKERLCAHFLEYGAAEQKMEIYIL